MKAQRFDLAFWSWAQTDPEVRAVVEQVRNLRHAYIGSLLEAAGYAGQELEARTRLFVVYHSWSPTMFPVDDLESETAVNEHILAAILSGGSGEAKS